MSKKIKIILIFLICIRNIYAQDTETSNVQDVQVINQGIQITSMEAEFLFNADYNRTFDFVGGVSVAGRIEFNNRLDVKEGIYVGWTEDVTFIKLFNNSSYRILANLPLEVKFAWVYNGIPEYETHAHAIAPIISWNARYYGISVGFGVRFTSFFNEGPLIELILPLGIYVNFINDEKICVGMSMANYTDFQLDSFIAFALAVKASIRINGHFSIINELEFRQSGADGLTAAFHGIVWKGGAKLTW